MNIHAKNTTAKGPKPSRQLLVIAIASISLGLVGCGGSDNKAASCVGEPSSNPDDCRNFDDIQTPETPTPETPTPETPTPETPTPETPTPEQTAWTDFEYSKAANTALNANPSIAFDKHHKDESFADIDILSSTAVVSSYYHNYIRRFDLNDGVATLQQALPFAASASGRDEVDALSGATEQLLTGIDIAEAPSGLVVVGQVEAYSKDAVDTGVGIYANQADASNSFESVAFASPNSQAYAPFTKISAKALSKSGLTLAAASEGGEIRILDANTLTLSKQVTVDFSVHSLAFSDDGNWLYVGGKKKIGLFGGEGIVAVLDANSLNELGRLNSADAVDISALKALPDHQVIAQVAASDYALMLQWQPSGNEVAKQRKIMMPAAIKRMSANGNVLALLDSSNTINVVDLSSGKRSEWQASSGNVNDIAIDDSGFVWTLSGNRLTSIPYSF